MKKNLINSPLNEKSWLWMVLLGLALLVAFGLRLINLTNPPLDFAATRQLFSALKARGMYYQFTTDVPEETRQLAISLGEVGNVEPPVLETLVSQTYRLTGEHVWIARIFSSFFWVIAGLALFLLIRELSSTVPALIGTLFYLFLPFGVTASRAFMPDPLMVAVIVFSLWALFRWQNTGSWKWAIIFGLLGGMAIFIKNVSAFFILGGLAGVILGIRGVRRSLTDKQVWVIAVLIIVPVLTYMLYGIFTLHMGDQFALRFFPKMWIDPAWYYRWAFTVNLSLGWAVVLFSVMGVFLADPRRARPLLLGLWVGYILFGFTFPYHFYTHNYYQLPFISVVAVSMAPALQVLFEKFLKLNSGIFPKLVITALVLVGITIPIWYSRVLITKDDFRNEPEYWSEIGDTLGHDGGVVALTQDYGYRLAYWGWQPSTNWFTSGDIALRYLAGETVDTLQMFQQDTAGKKYFLITLFNELDNQPEIKNILESNYSVFAQTDDYIIYDLEHPVAP